MAIKHGPINSIVKTCRWVLASGKYCEKPTEYTIRLDDDSNKRRHYESFCPVHLARVRADEG